MIRLPEKKASSSTYEHDSPLTNSFDSPADPGTLGARENGRREVRRMIGTHFEYLEPRAMMTGNPGFTSIGNQTVLGSAPTWLALTGTAPNGGTLTYTVSVANPTSNPNLLQAIIPTGNKSLVLSTSGAEAGVTGQMTFQLFDNLMPLTTQHIEQLVNDGEFDTNSTFYRIAASGSSPFVIQGGPSATTSSLGKMDDEFNADLQFTSPGLLAMAKSSDDTGDSQIFVTAGPTRFLDFQHSIFGIITAGDSVRQAIQSNVPASGDGQPPTPITITDAQIHNSDPLNGSLELKAAPGASGSSDVTVTVTDTTGPRFLADVPCHGDARFEQSGPIPECDSRGDRPTRAADSSAAWGDGRSARRSADDHDQCERQHHLFIQRRQCHADHSHFGQPDGGNRRAVASGALHDSGVERQYPGTGLAGRPVWGGVCSQPRRDEHGDDWRE